MLTLFKMRCAAAPRYTSLAREMGQSLYELLRIEKNATNDQIKQAYRKVWGGSSKGGGGGSLAVFELTQRRLPPHGSQMALKYHPDKNPSDDARDMVGLLLEPAMHPHCIRPDSAPFPPAPPQYTDEATEHCIQGVVRSKAAQDLRQVWVGRPGARPAHGAGGSRPQPGQDAPLLQGLL